MHKNINKHNIIPSNSYIVTPDSMFEGLFHFKVP